MNCSYEMSVANGPVRPTLPLLRSAPTLPVIHRFTELGAVHDMALWTPYTEEALDLTKQNIEKSPDYPHLDRYYYESYGAPQTVPTSQISPDSIKSWDQEDETLSDDMEYQAFERDALQAMAERNGGSLLGNNPRMKRVVQSTQASDDMYRKQRERNNYAAKQSRDRRKLREVRLAFQVTFLKKKLAEMRSQLDSRACASCLHSR